VAGWSGAVAYTFLHYIQAQVVEHCADVNRWVSDLPSLDDACRLDLPVSSLEN